MYEHAYDGKFTENVSTESRIDFDIVRIPLKSTNGRELDARMFARDLVVHLNSDPLKIEVKLLSRGLGEAILILGEK